MFQVVNAVDLNIEELGKHQDQNKKKMRARIAAPQTNTSQHITHGDFTLRLNLACEMMPSLAMLRGLRQTIAPRKRSSCPKSITWSIREHSPDIASWTDMHMFGKRRIGTNQCQTSARQSEARYFAISDATLTDEMEWHGMVWHGMHGVGPQRRLGEPRASLLVWLS